MIKLIKGDAYKDGGTESYLLGDGIGGFLNGGQMYYLDGRLFSTTKGCWYEGYPEKHNGNLIDPESDFGIELNFSLAATKNK